MYKYLVLTIIIISISYKGFAQFENENNWQFSYYGDLFFHPGFQVGYQIPLKNWTKTKARKKKEITKYKSFNTGADFTYYWHPKNHHGLILSPYLSYQRVKQNGNYFQMKFSLGYHRSFVDGTTYTVDDNGNVQSSRFAGQNTLYNSLSFDFGKDLRVTKGKPLRWFFQIGISGRYPYNKSYLPNIHTGIGIHYFFQKK